MEIPIILKDKDKKFVNAFFNVISKQKGVFCIKDLVKETKMHRTQIVRELKYMLEEGIIQKIDNKIIRENMRLSSHLGRHKYYTINSNHPLYKISSDRRRLDAIIVLKEEFGSKANKFINLIKSKIKDPDIKAALVSLEHLEKSSLRSV